MYIKKTIFTVLIASCLHITTSQQLSNREKQRRTHSANHGSYERNKKSFLSKEETDQLPQKNQNSLSTSYSEDQAYKKLHKKRNILKKETASIFDIYFSQLDEDEQEYYHRQAKVEDKAHYAIKNLKPHDQISYLVNRAFYEQQQNAAIKNQIELLEWINDRKLLEKADLIIQASESKKHNPTVQEALISYQKAEQEINRLQKSLKNKNSSIFIYFTHCQIGYNTQCKIEALKELKKYVFSKQEGTKKVLWGQLGRKNQNPQKNMFSPLKSILKKTSRYTQT